MLHYEQVMNKLCTCATRKERKDIKSIEVCKEEEKEALISFLKQNLYYHTFILADLYHYGFDKTYQQIYVEKESGKIRAVFLRYFTNLILAGDPNGEACREIWDIVQYQVNTVMGAANLVKRFAEENAEIQGGPVTKRLYILENQVQLTDVEEQVYVAREKDIDRVHEFLMTNPEFRSIYKEKEMIRNRITNAEGEHLYFIADDEIMAHANTAASTPWACMLGGVAVKKTCRHQGLGHQIVSAVAKRTLENGQILSVFSECPEKENLFCDLGFQKIGDWGVLNVEKNERE